MELQIVAKNIELSETVRDRVQRKISRLSRHLHNITDVKVEISREMTKSPQQRYVTQVTLVSSSATLRGEERADDIYAAVDGAIGIIDHQIERYKGKLYHKGRGCHPNKD